MMPPTFRPRTPRFFYGWAVVGGMGLVGAVTINMAGANVSLFIAPMSRELGIGQAIFGWAITARVLAAALSGPFIGRLLDRYGPRVPMGAAAVVMGLGVASLGLIDAAWQIVLIFAVLGLIGMHGGASLYAAVPIAKWFVRRRGIAMSLMTVGVPAGFFVAAPLAQLAITRLGWRETWGLLGVIGGVLVLSVAVFVARRQPEDMGLLPDGDTRPVTEVSAHEGSNAVQEVAHLEERSWTRSEAMRTPTFWLVAIAFGMHFFTGASVGLFRVPHFVDRGFDPQVVSFALSSDAGMSILMTFAVGWAIGRVRVAYIALFGFLALFASTLLTITVSSVPQMFAASVLFGVGFPALVMLQNVVWPIYFGRRHVGAIRGAATPVILGFSAAGGPTAGIVKDVTGEYLIAWSVALVGLLVGALLFLAAKRPMAKGVG